MFKKGLALAATTLVAFGGLAAVDSLPASAQKVDGAPVNATFTIDSGFLQINDDTFEAGSAEDPVIATATVAPNGTLSNINITFPPLDPIVITDPINATLTVTIVIVGTPTGSIDPITGAANLNFQVDIRITGSPLNNGCHIGPVSITSGTGEVDGVPYDPLTGTVTLADHNFFVPGAQGCTAILVNVNQNINDELGLPTSNTHANFTAHVSPVLQAAIRPSFTATPSSGFAPLNVAFDASATYVARPSATYEWDLDNDGAFDDATGTTAASVYAAGLHTVRLRVTDDQGDFAIATRVVTSIEPSPDLAIGVDDGGSAFITGQDGQYTITVDNVGSAPTTQTIAVVDTLPAGLTFVSASGTGWACLELTGVVSCDHAGPVANGDSLPDITLVVHADGSVTGPIANTATVATAGDLNAANDSDTDPGQIIQAGIDLVIDKTHDLDDGLFRGERATYTLSVSNAGTAAASARIRISDTLPTGTSFVSASGVGWVCNQAGGVVSCFTDADLGPDSSLPPVNIRVDVAGDAPASLSNTGSVTVDGDANTGNNSDTDTGDVLGLGVDYDIAKGHFGDIVVGEPAFYSISVGNVGTATGGADVVVTDSLPAGLAYASSAGDGWSCVSTPPEVVCTHAGNVEPGDQLPKLTLGVSVGAAALPSVTNSASVAAAGDGNSENDTASDPGDVRRPRPDLEITKGHIGNLTQGSNGSYSISVRNVAAERSDGPIQVVDTLPAPLAFVSATGSGWSCAAVGTVGAVVTCDRAGGLAGGDLAPKITIVVSAPDNAPAIVTNTATVSSPGDTSSANDSASDPTRIDPRPKAPTAIMAEAIVLRLDLALVNGKLTTKIALVAAPRATLTNAVTHAPVAGAPIVFRTSNGALLCTGVTNANGLATCDPSLTTYLNTLLGLRYSATYNGDLDHVGSSTEGAILQINGIRLL